jgi:predicted alpha/beta-hydrolase family hydrolase
MSPASIHQEKVVVAGGAGVTVALAVPAGFRPGESPALVLAPGAGGTMESPFLVRLLADVSDLALTVRFNFPYQEAKRGRPDPQPRLEAAYRSVLAWLRAHPEVAPGRIVAGGKSMGGRIASHLAAAGEPLAGLVLLGYPLHPPGQPAKRREGHLDAIACPMLFVQGSRDRLCDLELLRAVLPRLKAPHRLHVIEEGDHSFKVPKRAGRSEDEIFAAIRDEVRRFVNDTKAGTGQR